MSDSVENPNLASARLQPSASYSFTMRLHMPWHGSAFARVAGAIADAEAMLGAIDLVRVEAPDVVRDVTVACVDASRAEAVRELAGVRVDSVSDRTFLMHKSGIKIEVNSKLPLKTRDVLSMAYTPGVGRVSVAIHENKAKVWALTIKSNTVAVRSDGSAVLGLGDIGPEAAMPVMEGKGLLFKEFGAVDAFPLCLATNDVEQIVAILKAVAPTFAESTWRTSARRAALTSTGACGRSWTFRCSTTISTAPRPSCSPRCSTRCASSANGSRTSPSWSSAPAPPVSPAPRSCSPRTSAT